MEVIDKASKNFLKKEKDLSIYATKSSDAIRLRIDDEDIRPAFFHDIDRIIHSLSYTRYINKTQVYTNQDNDHISKRMTHVQLVSKIARTIGRALNLNEDLIEAIALAHDIGHTPLGHSGEAMLDLICRKELNSPFEHNIQGVRYYKDVANINLTVQVLDGIMTHNGEMVNEIYEPVKKTKDEFLKDYQDSYKIDNKSNKIKPMTLEACVVRISDIIGYVGRDIEDAIMIDKFDRDKIPEEITSVLGNNNKDIVNTIILDIINESMDKPYIKMSKKVYEALFKLKKFNYENIYKYSLTKEEYNNYQDLMIKLYYKYLEDIKSNNKASIIYKTFLSKQRDEYLENTSIKRQVVDFIAGMTDDFFIRQTKYLKK